MPSVLIRESSAGNIAVGGNLMSGNRFQTAPRFRRVRRVGCTGSSAAGVGAFDIYYGATLVFNGVTPTTSGTTPPVESKDLLPVASDYVCQPGEPINLIVTTVSATNPFLVLLEIEEL